MKNLQIEIVTTTKQISDLVDWLVLHHASRSQSSPTMYLDLEGVNLCREGSISILTLLCDTGIPTKHVYLIDVHTLRAEAFNTAGTRGKTLKDILQDGNIIKVFFDVRNDSDALFSHFGVALRGVEDVQLMESATRKTTASRQRVSGLAKCIQDYVTFNSKELASWKLSKEKGMRLFQAEHGGSYAVFNQRPIPADIVAYCVGDVQHLPSLRHKFWTQQTQRWRDLVTEGARKRVAASQRADYQPKGPNRTMSPWTREENKLLDQWHYVPSPVICYDPFDPSDLNDDLDDDFDDDFDDEWYDDGPTSCRDIINDCDYHLYYSD